VYFLVEGEVQMLKNIEEETEKKNITKLLKKKSQRKY
jgi:hypothetical protein